MSNYHLPDFLPYGWEEIGYESEVIKFNKKAELLNRQVLFSELFTNFYKIPELSSFYLEVKTVDYKHINNENEFIKHTEEPIYQFNITNITTKSDVDLEVTKSILEKSISSFDNYLDGKKQEVVLLWLWKRGKEANLVSVRKNKTPPTYVFEINQALTVQLCEDAYKENYPLFYQDVLEKVVGNKENNEVILRKKI